MAAVLYIADSFEAPPIPGCAQVLLGDSASYWFLYRYFEAAKLPLRKEELIDLYGGAEISGYQLDRLIDELELAASDVSVWASPRNVLLGWNSELVERKTERRQELKKEDALKVIGSILALAREAKAQGRKLISSGD